VSATCGQEAFLEGHVHAFTILGGVPAGQIRYDNLTPAVTRVLRKGRARIENPRWTAFRSHYKSVPTSSRGCLVSELVLAAG
jgi:transposase